MHLKKSGGGGGGWINALLPVWHKDITGSNVDLFIAHWGQIKVVVILQTTFSIQIHFLEWKLLCFDSNFIKKFIHDGQINKNCSNGSNNGFAPNRQAIFLINGG